MAAASIDSQEFGASRPVPTVPNGKAPRQSQLIWAQTWYLRAETFSDVLARIIDAHHGLPVARNRGEAGRTSSDGQFFSLGPVLPRRQVPPQTRQPFPELGCYGFQPAVGSDCPFRNCVCQEPFHLFDKIF